MFRPCRVCGVLFDKQGPSARCVPCRLESQRARASIRRRDNPIHEWAILTLSSARRRTSVRGVPYSLTLLELESKVRAQEEACWYCGGILRFRTAGRQLDDSPTLDQVIPSGGYTNDNIVVACWRCNRAKSDSSMGLLENLVAGMRRWMDRGKGH